MKVFITGAAGWVGFATTQELIRAGHTVVGLSRSDANAKKLSAGGATVHPGDLTDLESLRRGAAAADAVIHCGFIHDFSKYVENCAIDKRAIDAMGEAIAGTSKPFVVTSGSALLSPGKVATEESEPPANSPIPRVSEQAAFALLSRGVKVSAIRLPPTVHGEGDHGFIPILIGIAREKGVSAYVGDGANRWPAVHRLDAALLYRLALEKGAAGAKYHAVAEEGVPFREIAEVIGKHLKVPVVSKRPDEAVAHFGFFGHFAGLDAPASSEKTKRELGWKPAQIGLISDLDHDYYFKG